MESVIRGQILYKIKAGCLTKAKELNLPDCLPTDEGEQLLTLVVAHSAICVSLCSHLLVKAINSPVLLPHQWVNNKADLYL